MKGSMHIVVLFFDQYFGNIYGTICIPSYLKAWYHEGEAEA